MFRLVIPIACLSVRVIARLVATFFSRPEIVRFTYGMLSVDEHLLRGCLCSGYRVASASIYRNSDDSARGYFR